MIQITYRKRNGEIIQRIRNTYCSYRIGDTTSMGWVVLDIRYNFNGKYYQRNEYDNLINRAIERDRKRIKIKKALVRFYRELAYCLILLILFRGFTLIENIII